MVGTSLAIFDAIDDFIGPDADILANYHRMAYPPTLTHTPTHVSILMHS